MAHATPEITLWESALGEPLAEDPRFLEQQLITYIGNKRSLLRPMDRAVQYICRRTGKNKFRVLDAFAGSGVVSRFFKQYATSLVSNDLEYYAKVIGDCYLTNQSAVDVKTLREHHQRITIASETLPVREGFIRRLYAPRCDRQIAEGERVFYTIDNAMRIDSLRHLIGSAPDELKAYLLAPLLAEASVHANTSGVFKGFYKNADGVGCFGGNNGDALTRIKGTITLPFPVFSRYECDVEVTQNDANSLVRSHRGFDIAYFDPPYNQHPYGSNYFMLNLIANNEEPSDISKVSGIPANWQRSDYNKRRHALAALTDLVEHTDAAHILISYNSEGFITRQEFDELLAAHGHVEVFETTYNTFRGSRNLRNRPIHVKEHLYLLERS